MKKAPKTPPVLPKPVVLPLSNEDLVVINAWLNVLSPEEILEWAIDYLPGLYQTTAFGLTGLVAIDMISKLPGRSPPLIFIDTLYHFPETYELVEQVKQKYDIPVHVYKPAGYETVQDFEAKHGKKLWETDEGTYDYVVKVR
jgi:phosphoadenosine phosphosulfate reductase